jgi:von Hippel-Lindau disease tumor suppressor protein
MLRNAFFASLLLAASPALADCDEISPVPAQALVGHPYFAENTPSQIRFINVRNRAVQILWVAFDGSERLYAQLGEGDQIVQPTFVAHRWLVRDSGDGTPLEGFISTRAGARSNGTPQIALIR